MADNDDNGSRKDSSPWPIIIGVGIVFLPGFILAWGLWGMLRWGKQRPSVIGSVALVIALITIISIGSFGLIPLFGSVFSEFSSFSENWPALIPLWVAVSFLIGAPLGFIASVFSAHQMKKNPHLVELSGDWRYQFTYRKTPMQKLRRKKLIHSLKAGKLDYRDRAPLGVDEKREEKPVYRYDTEAQTHTLINGQTGSGKTVTLASLARSDIQNGKTVVVMDFKRSPELAAKLAAWSEEEGREFYHFMSGDAEDYDILKSKGQCYYDPLKSGTPTSRADMVLGMREYDTNAAVYQMAMQQLLQVLFSMLRWADQDVARSIDWSHGGIYQLASAVAGNNLSKLVEACAQEVPEGVRNRFPYVKQGDGSYSGQGKKTYVNTPVAQSAFELQEAMRKSNTPLSKARDELQGQMRTIISSEYGQWMKTGVEGSREIDLYEQLKEEGNVILFSLNSDSEPLFAKFVGSMILADLTNISAVRRNNGLKNQVNIYVDEFQAVPPSSVTSLLEKARESRMALTLANQSLDQIIKTSDHAGEAYLNSILDTCGNFISHAGATTDSAIKLSKLLGQEQYIEYSKTNKNESSFLSFNFSNKKEGTIITKKAERWRVDPSEFMKLSSPSPNNDYKSTAIFIAKTSADPLFKNASGAIARTVWMVPDNAVLETYYNGDLKEGKRIDVDTLPATVRATIDTLPEAVDESENMLAHLTRKRQEASKPEPLQVDRIFDEYAEDEEYEPEESFEWSEIAEDEDEEVDSFKHVKSPVENSVSDIFNSSAPPAQAKKPQPLKKDAREQMNETQYSLPSIDEFRPSAPQQEPRKARSPLPKRPVRQEQRIEEIPLPDL